MYPNEPVIGCPTAFGSIYLTNKCAEHTSLCFYKQPSNYYDFTNTHTQTEKQKFKFSLPKMIEITTVLEYHIWEGTEGKKEKEV